MFSSIFWVGGNVILKCLVGGQMVGYQTFPEESSAFSALRNGSNNIQIQFKFLFLFCFFSFLVVFK